MPGANGGINKKYYFILPGILSEYSGKTREHYMENFQKLVPIWKKALSPCSIKHRRSRAHCERRLRQDTEKKQSEHSIDKKMIPNMGPWPERILPLFTLKCICLCCQFISILRYMWKKFYCPKGLKCSWKDYHPF